MINVCGNVATGKSHISKILQYAFDETVIYPEFIYHDPVAMEILKRRFDGRISALTFQNFILDKWMWMEKENMGKTGVKIFERLPDDAVKIFAKMSLTPEDYKQHKLRLKDIHLPSYKDMNSTNCTWIRYENNFTKDIKPLIDLVKSLKSEYIVIEVHSRTAFENYKYRNRKEEHYTLDEISQLQEAYDAFCDKQIKRIGCDVIDM